MSELKFDEILDECLSMLQAGASIDDCVAPYPQHADELRDRLEMAQSLSSARPEIQLDQAAQAQNRARLLAAVAEQLKAADVEPTLGLVPQIRTLFRGARRLALLPYALPVALVLLLTLGGLTAAAAVLQPDVPIVRDIFGSDSDQPPSVSVPSETPSTNDSDSASSSDDEPRIEFEGGECELRGLITSLDPLAVNGVTVDESSASRIRVDLAQAFADGTRVRVKGASMLDDGTRICVADEIKLDDEEVVAEEPPRIEFEGGECELRGLITSLAPLAVNGVPVDDSSASRIRVDLAQAFTDGTRVRVRGTSILDDGTRICVADEIKLDDEGVVAEEPPRIELERGGCELRGLITSLDPLAVNGVPVDDSSASRIRVDLAQAFADGTRVRVEGASMLDDGTRICVADEIRLDDEEVVAEEPPRIELEGGGCELRGLITSLDPLAVNGVPVDDSSASRIRVDLAQAFTDGTRVRVRGASIPGNGTRICVADEIRLDD